MEFLMKLLSSSNTHTHTPIASQQFPPRRLFTLKFSYIFEYYEWLLIRARVVLMLHKLCRGTGTGTRKSQLAFPLNVWRRMSVKSWYFNLQAKVMAYKNNTCICRPAQQKVNIKITANVFYKVYSNQKENSERSVRIMNRIWSIVTCHDSPISKQISCFFFLFPCDEEEWAVRREKKVLWANKNAMHNGKFSNRKEIPN